MTEFREDAEVYPIAVSLAGCLCAELAASGLPEPCFCGVLPGAEAPHDYCGGCADGSCGGMAWVRIGGVFPSVAFPAPDSYRAQCDAPLAVEFEIAVVRCAPMPGPHGEPPDMDAQLLAVRLQMADMQAVRRAIQCCAKTSRLDHVIGEYTPVGPIGGCVGGSWRTAFSVI